VDRHAPQGARDDKGGVFYHEGSEEVKFSFCHCEEDDRTTRQSIVSRGMRTTWLFAYGGSSGSPRAAPSR
jgi:hypothetical protein